MGAQPKNKITRVERGKRRAGNTPKLQKDVARYAVHGSKQSLFKNFLNLFSASEK